MVLGAAIRLLRHGGAAVLRSGHQLHVPGVQQSRFFGVTAAQLSGKFDARELRNSDKQAKTIANIQF